MGFKESAGCRRRLHDRQLQSRQPRRTMRSNLIILLLSLSLPLPLSLLSLFIFPKTCCRSTCAERTSSYARHFLIRFSVSWIVLLLQVGKEQGRQDNPRDTHTQAALRFRRRLELFGQYSCFQFLKLKSIDQTISNFPSTIPFLQQDAGFAF
jgi:hypothetical protein